MLRTRACVCVCVHCVRTLISLCALRVNYDICFFSKFGSSKRMSEGDKKQIQSIVAIKIQMAKEEWREEVCMIHSQLIV